MTTAQVLLLPGWQDSGPGHWQTEWEGRYGYLRVQQHDWMRPLRGDWIARLEEVVLAQSGAGPIVFAAHSLGCLLVAAWAAHSRHTALVQGALLVAPGDPQREHLQGVLHSWLSPVRQRLPFHARLLGSRNDPHCSHERAQEFAESWGADFVDYGACGHINAESGLGTWDDGHALLRGLCNVVKENQW